MHDLRPQRKWTKKADNTILSVVLSPEADARIADVLATFRESMGALVSNIAQACLRWNRFQTEQSAIIDTPQQLDRVVAILSAEKFLSFRVFNEELRSYKGYCTWTVFHSLKGVFLVDLVKLRMECHKLKKVIFCVNQLFEDPTIVKIGLAMDPQLLWLQRDFGIFTANVFDLKETLSSEGIPADPCSLSKQLFISSIQKPERSDLLYMRPIGNCERDYLIDSTTILMKLIATRPKLFLEHSQQELERVYYNSNYHCRNSYSHRSDTIKQLEQMIFSGKQNATQATEQSFSRLKKLIKWRQHTAKMKDESVQYILPNKILKQIILRDIKSMLELRNVYTDYDEKEVSRDHLSEIVEVLNEKKKKFDPQALQQEVLGYLDKPLELFKSVGWIDKDWRNNDFQSMKLYKEIISMEHLEPSIIEDELKSTEPKTLSNAQLMCLFNYAKHWNDPSLLKMHHKQFKENKAESDEQVDLNGRKLQKQQSQNDDKTTFKDKFPQRFLDIYEMANRKKKDMKKEKKRPNDQKEQPFVLNTKEFLRSIGWA